MKERVEQIVEGVNSLKINEKQTLEYWKIQLANSGSIIFNSSEQVVNYLKDAQDSLLSLATNHHEDSNFDEAKESLKTLRDFTIEVILNKSTKSFFSIKIDNLFLDVLKCCKTKAIELKLDQKFERSLENILSFRDMGLELNKKRKIEQSFSESKSPIQHAIRDVEVGGSRGR